MQDIRTQVIHHPYRAPDAFEAPQPGVFKASTVIFPNVATMRSRDHFRPRAGPLLMRKPGAEILPMKMQDFQGATINL